MEMLTLFLTNPDDPDLLGAVIAGFQQVHKEGRNELVVKGQRIYDVSGRVAGLVEYYYAQWREACAILDVLKQRQVAAMQAARKMYLEHYNRELTPTVAEKYAAADAAVLKVGEAIIRMELVTRDLEGVYTGIDKLHQQVKILAALREHQIEDATI